MEGNKQDQMFSQKEIVSKDGRNLINLRRAQEEPAVAAGKDIAEKENSGISSESAVRVFPINFLDRLVEIGIYLLVFMMPLFTLPFSFEIHEFNKAFLLVFASSALLLVWTVNNVFLRNKVRIFKSPAAAPFLLFIAALFLSAVFGVDKTTSFLGYYGNFSDSFSFYLGLFIFYFLATNLFIVRDSNKVAANMVFLSVCSAAVVSIFSIMYFRGSDFLSFLSASGAGFNLVSGYSNVFSAYLLAGFFMALYDLFFFNRFNFLKKSADVAAIVLILLNLVLIGWSIAYLLIFVLIMPMAIYASVLNKKSGFSKNGAMLLILAVFSGALLATSIDAGGLKSGKLSMGDSSLAASIRKSLNTESVQDEVGIQGGFDRKEAGEIAKASFKESPVLGSGIGTYYYDFSKYRTGDFNYGDSWALRFGKAYNEMLEKISTIGAFGVLSYLLLILSSLLLFVKIVRKERRDAFLFAAFLSLLVFQFLFLETAVLRFMFVLLLVLAAGRLLAEEDRFSSSASFTDSEKKILSVDMAGNHFGGKLVSFAGMISVVVCLAGAVYCVQFFRAEAAYKEISMAEVENIDTGKLDRIISLNPYKGEYYVGISRIYIARVNKLISKKGSDEAYFEQVRTESEKVLFNARKAVEISPDNVSFWENYGFVHKRMSDLSMEGAEDPSIEGFENASRLDPQNPIFQTEIGKVYMSRYINEKLPEGERSAAFQKAKSYFGKALEIKSDYPDAVAEMAFVYYYEGDEVKALSEINRAASLKKISIQTALQIGKLYYNLNEKEKAVEILNVIIALSSDNSDAHYILGVIYNEEKKYEQALEEFNIVLSLNPGNTDIIGKISDIEGAGKSKSGEKDDDAAYREDGERREK